MNLRICFGADKTFVLAMRTEDAQSLLCDFHEFLHGRGIAGGTYRYTHQETLEERKITFNFDRMCFIAEDGVAQ